MAINHTSDPNREGTSPPGFASTSELAKLFRVSPGRMRAILSEMDVAPADRRTGRGGEHVYRISLVRAEMRKRPGQGARTDLRK